MAQDSPIIFVTGGTGFVGRHILQGLQNHGYRVRLLSRRAPEGMDSSIEVVEGDLTHPALLAPALGGVFAVIHAALTDGLSQDLQATSELHRLSGQAGVRQFIHLSTISVYGNPAGGEVTEETTPIPSPDVYSSTKLAIEEALRRTPGCPEVAVLRLGCVYGPGKGWWTQGLLNMMANGKVILVNDGTGYANLIHAQDVGAIIRLLLARSNPAYEIYNVTDGEPVSWSCYFSEIEKIFGQAATIPMSDDAAREYGRKWLRPSLLRRLIRKATGGSLIYPLDDWSIKVFASRAVYSNEKAARILGFRPMHDLKSGMETVREDFISRS